jgi:hypothetical protein
MHIAVRRNQMSTAQETSNKARFRRIEDAVNLRDSALSR